MKNPKIDIFFGGQYVCSTKQSKTVKEALLKFIASIALRPDEFLMNSQNKFKHDFVLRHASSLDARKAF